MDRRPNTADDGPDSGVVLTGPHDGELDALAALAARCQADPQRICVYTGDDAASIAADVIDVEGWPERLVVARRDDTPVGWLLGEVDTEMARVWWWGPFVDDGEAWHDVADVLSSAARRVVGETTGLDAFGEELAADASSTLFAEFAARHGFAAEEASACLVLHTRPAEIDARVGTAGVEVRPLAPAHADVVARLHDELFPGTHTTGRSLVAAADDRHPRLVAIVDGEAVGYVATEHQHDGSLYVDFLGVRPDLQGRGIGRSLVSAACRAGFDGGATHAHLTVRASNLGARALYAAVGFAEERLLAPYRRGFTIDVPATG